MPAITPVVPISLVKNVGTNTSNSTSITSLAVTVPAGGCAFGNLVVVRFAGFNLQGGTGSVTIADTRSNTWHLDFAKTNITDGINQVWSSVLTTALQSGDTITVTFPANNNNYAMGADEFTGMGPLAGQPWAVDGTGATGSSTTPSDTLNPGATTPAVLWYAPLFVASPSTDTFTEDSTNTVGGAWTSLTAAPSASGAQTQSTRAAYKVPNTSLSSSQTWAPTLGTSRGWIETLIVYSGHGTGVVTQLPPRAVIHASTR